MDWIGLDKNGLDWIGNLVRGSLSNCLALHM